MRLNRLVRSHCTCVILADARPHPARYVLDPRSGSLLMCVSTRVFDADDVAAFIPDDSSPVVKLAGVLEAAEDHPAQDRYLARFVREPRQRWGALRPDYAAFEARLLDADEIDLRNPLATQEPGILKRLNGDSAFTAALARRLGTGTDDRAVVVGIDPWGADARVGHVVLRVGLDAPAFEGESLESSLRARVTEPGR